MVPKYLAWFALAAALTVGLWLRAIHVDDPHRLTPNERAYLYDAARLHDEGLSASRPLFVEYMNDPDLWAVAQPARIGYILLLDLTMTVTGTTDIHAGMTLSFLASALTLLLVAWLGIRFFNPWVAAVSCALCATAFTEIWLVRGTPQDGVFGLLALAEIWIACEIMRTPRRYWLYLPLHVVGIWEILIKQSGVFVYGFCAAWLLGYLLIRERKLRPAIWLVACFGAGLALVCAAYVYFAGDAHTAWRVYTLSYISNAEAWSYNEECCFGPPLQLPFALWLLSPLTFTLALAGFAAVVTPARWNRSLTTLQRNYGGLCALMAVGFAAMFAFFSGMQVVRFLTPGDGAICLAGGVGLCFLMSMVRPRLGRNEYGFLVGLAAAALLCGMVRDYRVFDRVAMQVGIPELGAIQIRSALGH
jgi:hypothetical protein